MDVRDIYTQLRNELGARVGQLQSKLESRVQKPSQLLTNSHADSLRIFETLMNLQIDDQTTSFLDSAEQMIDDTRWDFIANKPMSLNGTSNLVRLSENL